MTNKVLGGGALDGSLGLNPTFADFDIPMGRVVQSVDDNGTVFYWLVESTSKGGWLLANGLYANPTAVVGDSLPVIAGSFVDGFTFTAPNQVGIDSSGDEWKYIGDDSLPVIVAPNTDPSASGDFKKLGKPSTDDYLDLKIFQSPTNGGLTEIQTKTADAGEVYEVRKSSDDSLATIYSDAAGTTEIVQDGTSNVSGGDGAVGFFVENGDYYVISGLSRGSFLVGGLLSTSSTSLIASESPPTGLVYKPEDIFKSYYKSVSTGSTNNLTRLDLNGTKIEIPQTKFEFLVEPIVFSESICNIPESTIVKTNSVGEAVLTFSHPTENLSGVSLKNIELSQPNDPNMAGGTANNHFCVALSGCKNSKLNNLYFNNVDLCAKLEYGDATLADRSCNNITIDGLVGVDVRGMGLQVFGAKGSSGNNMIFTGDDGFGGRGQFHGLRLTAFDFAENIGNSFDLYAKNFTTGVSLQQYSKGNTVNIISENCGIGAQAHGRTESVPSGAESTGNTINITAIDCDRVIYGGSSFNTFNVSSTGCLNGILDDFDGGNPWLSKNNTYKGTIKDCQGRLLEVKGDKTTVDLRLIGVGALSTHGAIVSGTDCNGSLVIDSCDTPIIISGGGAILNLKVTNCTNGSSITGSGNVVNINTDGDLSLTGSGNVITGNVSGNITGNISDNDISGLSQSRKSKRLFSQSTNAGGELTVTHNLGFDNTVKFNIFRDNGNNIEYASYLKGLTNNSFTFVIKDSSGALASSVTGLIIEYEVNAI